VVHRRGRQYRPRRGFFHKLAFITQAEFENPMHRQIPLHHIVPLLVIGMALIVPASAQIKTVEETSRSLLNNEQVKVKELRLAPRSKLAPAAYPNSFVYPLTDGTIVFTHPGKTPFEMSFRAGEALWLPSQLAATSNETDKEIRALVVEIKAKPPVAPRKGKAKAKGGTKTVAAKAPGGEKSKK
jgi:hypothetical protein